MKKFNEWRVIREQAPEQPPAGVDAAAGQQIQQAPQQQQAPPQQATRSQMGMDVKKDMQTAGAKGGQAISAAVQAIIGIAQQNPAALTKIVTALDMGVKGIEDPQMQQQLQASMEGLKTAMKQISDKATAGVGPQQPQQQQQLQPASPAVAGQATA
jgi:hypothetical protein